MERIIVLVDMDCFYVQVEQRLDPSLQGLPCAVIQYNEWQGGSIIAVNYEARNFGVKRPMKGNEAKALCPDIKLVKVPEVHEKADLTRYRDASAEVIDVLKEFSENVERASVDEAFIDLTETVEKYISEKFDEKVDTVALNSSFIVGWESENLDSVDKEAKRKESISNWLNEIYKDEDNYKNDIKLAIGAKLAEEIRQAVYKKTQFRCSAGIAHNKIIAKLCCGVNKPNKQTIVPQSSISHLYSTIPIKKVRGFGGKFGENVMEKLNVTLMSELSTFSENYLKSIFGDKSGKWLFDVARGLDHEHVLPRLTAKSIGCGKNFLGPKTLKTKKQVKHWLYQFAMELEQRLTKDRDVNKRTAKHMSVGLTTLDDSNRRVVITRSCPITSYSAESLHNSAFLTLSKANSAPKSSDAWMPPVINVSINVGKFEDNLGGKTPITKFFSRVVQSPSSSGINETQPADLDDEKSSFFTSYMKNKVIQQDNNDNSEFTESHQDESENVDCKESINIIKNTIQQSDSLSTSGNKVKSLKGGKKTPEKTKKNKSLLVDMWEKTNTRNPEFTGSRQVISESVDCKEPIDAMKSTTFPINASGNTIKSQKSGKEALTKTKKNKISLTDMWEKANTSERSTKWHTLDANEIDDEILENLPMNIKEEIIKYKNNTELKRRNNVDDASVKLCPKCNKEFKIEEFSEHLDYHAAQELYEELNSSKPITSNSNKCVTKRTKPSKNSKSKKMKLENKINSYFQ